MGAFRMVLCWLVVAAHVDPATASHAGPAAADAVRFGGPLALFCFYAVSGYYMTLTLTSTYDGPGGLRAYYLNRFLRIVPLYLAILAASAPLVPLNANPTRDAWNSVQGGSAVAAAAAQATPLGQEGFHWLHIEFGALKWTSDFRSSAQPAWHLLILPTCWSLSIECWFYLLAPFLVRRGVAARLAIAAAGFVAWGAVFAAKLPADPWIYRFFPAALGFFMAGSLARTMHERKQEFVRSVTARTGLHAAMVGAILAAMVAFRLLAPRFPGPVMVVALVPLYAAAVAAIPFLFAWSAGKSPLRRLDRFLADVAFPIFLVHYPILRLTGWTSPLAILGASAAVGAITVLAIDRPLARFKAKPVSAPALQ